MENECTRGFTRDEAIEALARILYETEEHLDPDLDDFVEWVALPERDREFYCLCISALLNHRSLLEAAADDYVVAGHSDHREQPADVALRMERSAARHRSDPAEVTATPSEETVSHHHMSQWHYEHIPERGPDKQYRVADADDDVVASFATEEEAAAFVRGHNDSLRVRQQNWRS